MGNWRGGNPRAFKLSHVSPKKMGVSHLETAAGDDSPPYLVDQDPEVPGSENTTKGWCFQALPRNVWTCESNGIIIIIIFFILWCAFEASKTKVPLPWMVLGTLRTKQDEFPFVLCLEELSSPVPCTISKYIREISAYVSKMSGIQNG